jgi:hypothetical protein
LDGLEAIDRLLRDLPPEANYSGARAVLNAVIRHLRYGRVPDIRGQIVDNLNDLKSSFVSFNRPDAWGAGGSFEMTQARTNSMSVHAEGFLRRWMFPHVRDRSGIEHRLAYVQIVRLSLITRKGQPTAALILNLSIQGDLRLLAPGDRDLIERAQRDSAALWPAPTDPRIENSRD